MGESAMPKGMKAWNGAASFIPSDWNGGDVMFDDGTFGVPKGHQWQPFGCKTVQAYAPVAMSKACRRAAFWVWGVCLWSAVI